MLLRKAAAIAVEKVCLGSFDIRVTVCFRVLSKSGFLNQFKTVSYNAVGFHTLISFVHFDSLIIWKLPTLLCSLRITYELHNEGFKLVWGSNSWFAFLKSLEYILAQKSYRNSVLVMSVIGPSQQKTSKCLTRWWDSVSSISPLWWCWVTNRILTCSLLPFSVIGKGGEQISRIQLESGCKIQIAPGEMQPAGPYFWSFTQSSYYVPGCHPVVAVSGSSNSCLVLLFW